MLFKVIVIATVAAMVHGSVLYPTFLSSLDPYPTLFAQLHSQPTLASQLEETGPDPAYSFSYDVNEPSTGDVKSQRESREDGLVEGQYSLVQPDGVRRIVDYRADAVSGFSAVVKNEEPSTTTEGPKSDERPAQKMKEQLPTPAPRVAPFVVRSQERPAQQMTEMEAPFVLRSLVLQNPHLADAAPLLWSALPRW